jgi:hypothetical protein
MPSRRWSLTWQQTKSAKSKGKGTTPKDQTTSLTLAQLKKLAESLTVVLGDQAGKEHLTLKADAKEFSTGRVQSGTLN